MGFFLVQTKDLCVTARKLNTKLKLDGWVSLADLYILVVFLSTVKYHCEIVELIYESWNEKILMKKFAKEIDSSS